MFKFKRDKKRFGQSHVRQYSHNLNSLYLVRTWESREDSVVMNVIHRQHLYL